MRTFIHKMLLICFCCFNLCPRVERSVSFQDREREKESARESRTHAQGEQESERT